MSDKKVASPRKHRKQSKHKEKEKKKATIADEHDEISSIKSGILSKKGHVRKNWKERWFVLRETTLYYYEKKVGFSS
jgi:PH domain